MRRRLYRGLAAAIALTGTGGCVQMTRHSNTMLFGTNTVFGIAAGQDANSVPSVTVGYKRQEAVIMPLVANTASAADGRLLAPCDLKSPVAGDDSTKFLVHPCLLVGHNGSTQDSYSVLASFGANFEGNGTSATASGGLAQYFATGVAAQILALRGGASVIAVGIAAEKSAEEPTSETAVAALLGNPEVIKQAQNRYSAAVTIKTRIVNYLKPIMPDTAFMAEVVEFEKALKPRAPTLSNYCAQHGKDACLATIGSTGLSGFTEAEQQAALNARLKARGDTQ